MVVAPHQDDETLGCGGTIARKRAAGLPVTILFLTDGSRSHASLIDPDELSGLRRCEALEAAARLGVSDDCVRFLDFPEGSLTSRGAEVAEEVLEVLHLVRPDEVYVTAAEEPHPDHAASARLVLDAVEQADWRPRLFEYPVWAWYHWPHVPLPLTHRTIGPGSRARYELRRVLRGTVQMRCGWAIETRYPVRVDITSVSTTKRRALESYRSQLTRLRSTPQWAVLSDVGGGEFQELFFRGEERFRPVDVGAR